MASRTRRAGGIGDAQRARAVEGWIRDRLETLQPPGTSLAWLEVGSEDAPDGVGEDEEVCHDRPVKSP